MRRTPALLGLVFALLLGGCGGGGSHKSSSTSTTTSSTATHASKGKKAAAPKTTSLSQTVVVAGSGSPPSATAQASKGASVEFLTRVPGKSTSRPVKVDLVLARTSPTQWTATATVKNKTSTATLTSKDGQPLKLVQLRYTCALPPATTFCPAHNTSSSSSQIKAQFKAAPTTPIAISGLVGPVPNALAAPRSSSLLAPTYKVLTTVVGVAKHASKSAPRAKPTQTASVTPGDGILIRVTLTGTVIGAPQPVTVTFAQGPATSLTVSAKVPGGAPSKATINSANGKPLDIILPRYGCYLPPAPTFCPPSSVQAASHQYTVVFPSVPKTPPITIQAQTQAG